MTDTFGGGLKRKSNKFDHITEIAPDLDTMPEWAQEAFNSGQFFAVAIDRVKAVEAKLKAVGELLPEWYKYDYENPESTGEYMDSADCAEQIQAIIKEQDK